MTLIYSGITHLIIAFSLLAIGYLCGWDLWAKPRFTLLLLSTAGGILLVAVNFLVTKALKFILGENYKKISRSLIAKKQTSIQGIENRKIVNLTLKKNFYFLAGCFYEEVLYRYFLFYCFLTLTGSLLISAILSATAFSISHLNLMKTIELFLMGFLLSLLFMKTSSILYPVVAHFVNNILVLYTQQKIIVNKTSKNNN